MQIIKYVPRASGDEPFLPLVLIRLQLCAPRQRG